MKKVLFMIIVSMLFVGSAYAQTVETAGSIEPAIKTMCIDGYEYLVGATWTGGISLVQKFEILYKRNGRPWMVLPIPCVVEPPEVS